MLARIIMAVVAGAIAYLVCIFVGGVLLVGLGIPLAVSVGKFLEQWAAAIAVLVAIWYFFGGGNWTFWRTRTP
ncbi:MAG TPA: hypothetical protein VGS01_09700 [Candidatus Limnocylindria bacterium]|jgi:hypothetical protein|nr:hypothetical protein [Candidatus Limnocylindria bacterium]